MAIITSVRIEAAPQRDGRLAVFERHTADGGEVAEVRYMALAADNLDAMLTVNGQRFLERLANTVR